MTTIDDVFPPLDDATTGDDALDAALALQVPPPGDPRYTVVSFVPGSDDGRAALVRAAVAASTDVRRRARAHLVALAAIGDPIAARPSITNDNGLAFLAASAHHRALASAFTTVCAAGDPDDVAVPIAIFSTHPWGELRVAVGRALLASAPRAVLEAMATVSSAEDPFPFARDVAVAAALRSDPASAFDRLAAAVTADVDSPTPRTIRGLSVGFEDPALPFDPRWVPLLWRFLRTAGEPFAFSILRARADRSHVATIAACADAALASGSWSPVLAQLATKLAAPELAPAMTTAVELALATKAPWMASAVDALAVIDSPATLDRLRAARAASRGTNRKLLDSLVERLARHAPATTTATATTTTTTTTATTKKKRAQKGDRSTDPARTALRSRLIDAGLGEARADELSALARERLQIVVRAPATALALTTGTSRLGGLPDLPRGTAWPGHDGEPLAFIAQLALADATAAWPEHPLPPDGLLSFFVRDDLVVDERGDLPTLASAVVWTPADAMHDLAPRPFPEALPERLRLAHAPCELRRTLDAPPVAVARRQGLLDVELQQLSALTTAGPAGPHHGLLGFGHAGYDGGLPPARQTLLLQHGSDERITFGDASSIFFCIPDAALKKRDFSRARALPDEM